VPSPTRSGSEPLGTEGSQYTERHSIKRTPGEAGNHQVIEATQGAERQRKESLSEFLPKPLRNNSIF